MIRVRQDTSVEELIGYVLWCYWDEGFEPGLDEPSGLGSGGEERKVRLSASGLCLRIVEDEGDVDEDFPGGLFLFDLKWYRFG